MYSVITWEEAARLLHDLLPGAKSFLVDDILSAAKSLRPDTPFGHFWQLDGQSDEYLFAQLLPASSTASFFPSQQERLLIVSEGSFARGWGPFVVNYDQLREFMAWHKTTFGYGIFCGLDLVVVLLDSQIVLFYHHEGYAGYFIAPQ